MYQTRHRRRQLYLLSVLVLLAAAALFFKDEKNGCLGLNFLERCPEDLEYQYRDYGDLLRFWDRKAAVDRQTNTIYLSEKIDSGTRYQDLQGRLTLGRSVHPMFFVWDEAFLDLPSAVARGHRFQLVIPSVGSYMTYDVVFTTLPVLLMEDPGQTELTEKWINVEGSLTLWDPVDPTARGYTIRHSDVSWHLRGHTSTKMPKKSFKLTLQKDGENRNLSLLGLGSDDDWILNPLSLDETKVKEQFLMSLWNEMAAETSWDPPISRGGYCEVVINGSYRGLYLLQRRVDKKYLGLDGDAILLKADGTAADDTLKVENCSIVYSPFHWRQTSALLEDLLQEGLGRLMVPRNYMDVSIFTQLGYLDDNAGFRNQFYLLIPTDSGYEMKILLWDMDMSMGACGAFGYDYDLTTTTPLLRLDYGEMLEAYPDLDRQIAQRWFELREGLLSDTHTRGLLEGIVSELNASGVLARDRERWDTHISTPPYDFLCDRLAWLDSYYREYMEQ